MTIAFVLGNGISRRDVSVPYLKQRGRVYGCNALYREHTPDVLVATDKPIALQIQNSGYPKQHEFYTRKPLKDSGGRPVPTQYHGYSSGPIAVSLAALAQHQQIYMIGFDMGPTQDNLFNNMYADTEFYKTSKHPPTFTGNWVKQLIQIMKDFPQTKFYRIAGPTTAEITEFTQVKNLQHQDLAGFLDRINNQKDL